MNLEQIRFSFAFNIYSCRKVFDFLKIRCAFYTCIGYYAFHEKSCRTYVRCKNVKKRRLFEKSQYQKYIFFTCHLYVNSIHIFFETCFYITSIWDQCVLHLGNWAHGWIQGLGITLEMLESWHGGWLSSSPILNSSNAFSSISLYL